MQEHYLLMEQFHWNFNEFHSNQMTAGLMPRVTITQRNTQFKSYSALLITNVLMDEEGKNVKQFPPRRKLINALV